MIILTKHQKNVSNTMKLLHKRVNQVIPVEKAGLEEIKSKV
jgi:hypothetical protein